MRWIESMLTHVAPNEGMQLDLPDSRRQTMGQFHQPVSEGERDVKSEDMQQALGTHPGEIEIKISRPDLTASLRPCHIILLLRHPHYVSSLVV